MPTWVIQRVESLAMHDGQDLSGGDKPLFVDRFSNENDFASALHEGGITGVVQDNDEQDNDNDDGNINTDEYPDDPILIALDTTSACG